MQETWVRSLGRRFPEGRNGNLIQYFLPGKFHRQRSLAGHSPWGRKELDSWAHIYCTGWMEWIWNPFVRKKSLGARSGLQWGGSQEKLYARGRFQTGPRVVFYQEKWDPNSKRMKSPLHIQNRADPLFSLPSPPVSQLLPTHSCLGIGLIQFIHHSNTSICS